MARRDKERCVPVQNSRSVHAARIRLRQDALPPRSEWSGLNHPGLRQFPRVFTPIETLAAPSLFVGFYIKYAAVLLFGLIALILTAAAAGIP